MKTHFKRWGCNDCKSPYTELWSTEQHLFLKVEKVYVVNDRGVQRDCTLSVADPRVQATYIGFEGWIVEPGEVKCNMWQFWIKEDGVWGRPCGASASSYRPPGTTKRRKPGEWYQAPWVPKEAVDDCIALFVKV